MVFPWFLSLLLFFLHLGDSVTLYGKGISTYTTPHTNKTKIDAEENNNNPFTSETYRLDEFPKGKVALHFPCAESNIFATNCACHMKCTEPTCKAAYKVCEKYKDSHGCKYVLLRGRGRNKIATMKRSPTAEEVQRFRIDRYPTTMDEVMDVKGPWQRSYQTHLRRTTQKGGTNPPFLSDLVKRAGKRGQLTLDAVMSNITPHPLCAFNNHTVSDTPPNTRTVDSNREWKEKQFLKNGIALVSLNYRTPMTLLNTMRTWNSSGLLYMVKERMIILNDPLPSEVAISLEHGFDIVQPKDIFGAKTSKTNVLTIGAAFYYALQRVKSEFVLFLENDFKMDLTLTQPHIMSELIGAAGMLHQGIEIVRMLSRKTKGCGTFKDCNHANIHLDAIDPMQRVRNWYSFYCHDKTKSSSTATHRSQSSRMQQQRHHSPLSSSTSSSSSAHVMDCLPNNMESSSDPRAGSSLRSDTDTKTIATTDVDMGVGTNPDTSAIPSFRCFTSWDSNWTLNSVMVKKSTMLGKKYPTQSSSTKMSIADIGLRSFAQQDAFESTMIHEYRWMEWKVPICISYHGLFVHEEIETSA